MGVGGLALAGTLSGFVGFYLTIKVFGIKNFLDMLYSKYAIYLLIAIPLFIAALLALKNFISVIS
jgi:putative peptidoglycan lipid II flippase